MTTAVSETPPVEREAPRLGEELPVFCERCGYSLHGLLQTRCEHCTILQFHCPECGHHQPINTLRPAAQTILGRIRGGWLVLVILFKLNLIGWTLFAWGAMGAEWAYKFDYEAYQAANQQYQAQVQAANAAGKPPAPMVFSDRWKTRAIDLESALAFSLFALPFGMVLRMALLRWKRGWMVGLILASLVMGCMVLGVTLRQWDRNSELPYAYTPGFLTLMALAFVCVILGAAFVWPIWTLLVHAFLPKATANSLLNWQRSLSNKVSALARPEAIIGTQVER